MGDAAAAVALAARIVLAGTLGAAAVAKLRQPARTRASFAALGAPRASAALAIAVPAAELALAAWLLVARASPTAAVVAAVVLGGFTVVVVRAAARGVPCPCFGARASGAGGPAGVVRNGVLVGLAVLGTGDLDGARAGGVAAAVVALAVPAAAAVLAAR